MWAHGVGCFMLSLGCIALSGYLSRRLHRWADAAEAHEVCCEGPACSLRASRHPLLDNPSPLQAHDGQDLSSHHDQGPAESQRLEAVPPRPAPEFGWRAHVDCRRRSCLASLLMVWELLALLHWSCVGLPLLHCHWSVELPCCTLHASFCRYATQGWLS